MGVEAEVASGSTVYRRYVRNSIDACDSDGKERAQKDKGRRCVIANAEEKNGNGNPSEWADGAEDLDDWVDHLIGRGIPAENQAERNS